MKKTRIIIRVALPCLILSAGLAFWWHGRVLAPEAKVESSQTVAAETPIEKSYTVLKVFNGSEFAQLYDQFVYPNTTVILTPPEITGNVKADERIWTLAKARGYSLKSLPNTNLIKYKTVSLQPKAYDSWLALQKAATDAKLKLDIVSGFRDIADQRQLFKSRLKTTADKIASGLADSQINEELSVTAPPGFSRHHTGYTVDLTCNGSNSNFKSTSCFKWLSADNYENAKKYGWIPSYPDGASDQGPEPEPWEYVWVGIDAVYE